MPKETTSTSQYDLPREGHYEIAIVETCKKKKIKEIWTVYDLGFSTVLDGENYGFVLSMFPSQMEEFFKAIGAKEVGRSKYEWDMEEVIGTNLSFNITHQDVKGTLRAVWSDVKLAVPSERPKSVEEINWES